MRGTMMTTPLQVSRLLGYGSTVHGQTELVTWTGADTGPSRTTFAEIGRQAARLAHALRDSLGITGDQRVATFMWNNAEHLIAYFAVPSMGAVLHPLNIRLSTEQLAYITTQPENKVIIVDPTLIPRLAQALPQLSTVEHVVVARPGDVGPLQAAGHVTIHRWDDLLAGKPDRYEWPVVDEDDAAVLCYTSGTTGNPKGVAYSHRSIWLQAMEVCMAETFGLGPATRELVIVPMFHATAWGLPYAAFMTGATLIMPDRFLQAEPIAQMIATERPTHSGAVPTIWNELLSYLDAHPTDVSSLKEVIVGGSACPPSLMRAFSEWYGIEVIQAWGMTETSPLGSVARPPAGLSPEETWTYRYTQGRAPAAVEMRVMSRHEERVGELEVRGPWVTGRYLGEDEPDRENFHDGWLRTGDVGTLSADGFLTLTDRAKDVIKSGGEWISSVKLEDALMAHPDVQEACVVGVPDEKWGERPLATVALRPGSTATADELRAFLGERVAHWQVPERWAFTHAIPHTSVGKCDKKAIRARYAEGAMEVVDVSRRNGRT